jgi:hypothetical protein
MINVKNIHLIYLRPSMNNANPSDSCLTVISLYLNPVLSDASEVC